jgi:hypothetical protein
MENDQRPLYPDRTIVDDTRRNCSPAKRTDPKQRSRGLARLERICCGTRMVALSGSLNNVFKSTRHMFKRVVLR